MKVKAYLEITMKIDEANRPAAAKVYTDYRGPFLDTIEGALTKDLLIRAEDVQVLHGFDSAQHAEAYLSSDMFKNDVFVGLKPLWSADPEVKIYTVAQSKQRRQICRGVPAKLPRPHKLKKSGRGSRKNSLRACFFAGVASAVLNPIRRLRENHGCFGA